MNVGDWWVSVFPSASNGSGWYVGHKVSEERQEVFGPYGSRVEAIAKSGMPQPKTELEEVWELATKMRNVVGKMSILAREIGDFEKTRSIAMDFDELAKKYGKQ